ncbi:hypothetical protein OIU85_004209 [Salix viminalis]|uniref:peroxidase n=1 Tax=Salix viminalis TaxID=40686 RepID=A0A9Q0PSD5_SALVM|nr:hypothetical protein OIU85_004209 [Salix viminalis]
MATLQSFFLYFAALTAILIPVRAQLTPDFYDNLGGPWYKVLLGRRDSRTASNNDANTNLPPPFFNFSQLLSNFQSHGLNLTDLVVLSAGHTIGLARDLIAKKGLLHSDQELFKGDGSGSDRLVKYYGYVNPYKFLTDFSASMIKMGNMKPLTGTDGEIRMNCRKVNN